MLLLGISQPVLCESSFLVTQWHSFHYYAAIESNRNRKRIDRIREHTDTRELVQIKVIITDLRARTRDAQRDTGPEATLTPTDPRPRCPVLLKNYYTYLKHMAV